MRLTPTDRDRLLIFTAAELARARRARGLQLNVPEATALIADTVCEAARDGARLMDAAAAGAAVLGVDDVLPGVPDIVREVKVEALFDDGTRMVAAWVRPGLVVAHLQPDPTHPDHEVCAENLARLRASTDARGRTLEVVELEAPTATHADGVIVDWSYVNHYVCNGAVILCAFDDPRDEVAAERLSKLYPGREVVLVEARPIFECGGGIHCITQQQPAV